MRVAVELQVVEHLARFDRLVEAVDGLADLRRVQLHLDRQFLDRIGLDRREHRRHEQRERLGVADRIGDLVGLLRDQAAPDGIALRPDILALVVETVAVAVDHDAVGHAVQTRRDAAVELRRARVQRHGVALRRIADRRHALVEQVLQHPAAVVGRAADDEVVDRVAPVFAASSPGSPGTRPTRRPRSARGPSRESLVGDVNGADRRRPPCSCAMTSVSYRISTPSFSAVR